ncbi:MAG TPA: ABC transporter substrate-binding protein [Hyphomicrobiaceae bacterium]|jgi:peptide/nickel transport system substrate-binding protein|nr:ABC transporter substrate-binding protein [Hyphomicrobiaceae bacterium]
MSVRRLGVAAFVLSSQLLCLYPANAQKQGGTLRIYHRDNPPSASLHEESTVSVTQPFMALFNNLVLFDQTKRLNSLETIVPELGASWSWDPSKTKLTFKLREGVKWHDGKPFTAKDVQCTWHAVIGKDGQEEFNRNPRKVWYYNLAEVTTNGAYEATFHLKEPQPSFLMLLASGFSPVYPCHVSQREMRTRPVGTGPFKFVELQRNVAIKFARNPDYWKPGKPYVDAIEMRIIESRSTRLLGFVAGEFDMTFDRDVSVPLLKDVQAQAPRAICELGPTSVSTNLAVNAAAPPFDNAKIRKAMALALDRQAFIDILTEGKASKGAAMLPGPEGQWALPPEELAKLPGYGNDVQKNQQEARKIMTDLGYGPNKALKVKVSVRNIAIYRDPAVILIDQLKKIYIDGELEPIDTTVWYAKVQRKDYSVSLNLTGVSVDDPDVNLVENYTCQSERNYTQYCNAAVDELIFRQSKEADRARRQQLVWEVERKLAEDVARPIIFHNTAATCWHPHVKGVVLHQNSIYNNWRLEDVWLDQ